jgi:hypothetical protein
MPCREGFRAHRLLGVPGFPGLPVVDELHGTLHEEHKLLKEARDVDRPKPLGHGEGEQHDQPRAVQKKKPPRQVLCGLGAPALPRLPMQQARLATARQPLKPPPPTAHALPPNPRTSPAHKLRGMCGTCGIIITASTNPPDSPTMSAQSVSAPRGAIVNASLCSPSAPHRTNPTEGTTTPPPTHTSSLGRLLPQRATYHACASRLEGAGSYALRVKGLTVRGSVTVERRAEAASRTKHRCSQARGCLAAGCVRAGMRG